MRSSAGNIPAVLADHDLITRSGILAQAACDIKHQTLLALGKRIQNLKLIHDKVSFTRGDGIDTIGKYAAHKRDVFFIDPPYTAGGKRAGSRLYAHSEIDHTELFSRAGKIQGDFLMTYDDDDRVLQMAADYSFAVQTVPMMNTHHATMYELLIGRNLSWVVC